MSISWLTLYSRMMALRPRESALEIGRLEPVEAKGDVLGYVGTSGNASGMPAHLHFGVYRWGRDPVDPLPLLLGQRFEEGAAAAPLGDAGG